MPISSSALVNNFLPSDLKEIVHGNPSSRHDAFSVDNADFDMTYLVDGDKLQGALIWLLGVDYVTLEGSVSDPTAYKLRRTLPAYHPVHKWAWCYAVKIQGEGFRGDDAQAVFYSDQNTPASWEHYIITAAYRMPKYNVMADSQVSNEYSRFLSKELFPHTELVSIETGCITMDAPGTDWNSKAPPGMQIAFRRETAGVKLIWHRVPLEWVQESDDSLPLKLLQVQGRVNDATFLGRSAETLLCKDIKLNKYVSPLSTGTFGQLYFMYDIEMDFIYYDPAPKGKAGETRTGWNFHPAPDYKYYYATNSGQPVYKSVDFTKIFTHYTDTITLT